MGDLVTVDDHDAVLAAQGDDSVCSDGFTAALSPAVVAKTRMVAETHREAIADAYQAGVTTATGTDAGVGPHGENLEELELVAEVGLSRKLRCGPGRKLRLIW